ncbi:substrate-binding domain-containing protein [Thiomicrorhabdus sp.]|uniref:substrate-binding domain-containing protein n=1 Tax=Thiomicrorhabdus sp. TaxID=2039724 RepID=UPI0029C81852|nr:substrate-binding domain-containing protein [Thiomicrorhabdus sp.]
MKNTFCVLLLLATLPQSGWAGLVAKASPPPEKIPDERKTIAYLVSDIRIPFWEIMSRGILQKANQLGYSVRIYSAHNQAKKELQNTIQAIHSGLTGLIVSPTNSSACATILEFAQQAGIPAVIADIGTDNGKFISYISSDNYQGAYEIGKVLAIKMRQLNWLDGSVGIIAIPQARRNGKARTAGFLKALDEAGIKGSGIRQQKNFSYQETYDYSLSLIQNTHDLRAIWLQGSDRYQAALDAIRDSGKQGQILLLTFDAEPEFLELIPQKQLVGAAMQQPFLMGEKAVQALEDHWEGKPVKQEIKLSVLAVSAENIDVLMPLIKRNVLGITHKTP